MFFLIIVVNNRINILKYSIVIILIIKILIYIIYLIIYTIKSKLKINNKSFFSNYICLINIVIFDN